MDQRSHWIHAPGNEQNPERAPSMGVKPTNPDPKNILGKRLELDPTLHPPLRALPPSFPNHSGKIWDCGWKTLPLERIKSGNFFLLGRKINPAHSCFFFGMDAGDLRNSIPAWDGSFPAPPAPGGNGNTPGALRVNGRKGIPGWNYCRHQAKEIRDQGSAGAAENWAINESWNHGMGWD